MCVLPGTWYHIVHTRHDTTNRLRQGYPGYWYIWYAPREGSLRDKRALARGCIDAVGKISQRSVHILSVLVSWQCFFRRVHVVCAFNSVVRIDRGRLKTCSVSHLSGNALNVLHFCKHCCLMKYQDGRLVGRLTCMLDGRCCARSNSTSTLAGYKGLLAVYTEMLVLHTSAHAMTLDKPHPSTPHHQSVCINRASSFCYHSRRSQGRTAKLLLVLVYPHMYSCTIVLTTVSYSSTSKYYTTVARVMRRDLNTCSSPICDTSCCG